MLLTLFVLFYQITTGDCLECAACINVTNPADCHNYQTCNIGDRCYTASHGVGMDTYFDMGCRTESECLGTLSAGLIGRSLGQVQCGQCCGIDRCNDNLCSKSVQVTNQLGTCSDDPTYDCAHIATLFNICSDINHAKRACRKFCGLCDLVDGAWSLWSQWSACGVSCGIGTLTRTRTCTDPPPAHGGLPCTDSTTDTKQCTLSACPIHGGWSSWQTWSACSLSCGIGTMKRHRLCNNPAPQLAGDHCFGDPVDFQTCFLKSCAVDGGWSSWQPWSACSLSCGIGTQKRHRLCNNPAPQLAGDHCFGDPVDFQTCLLKSCADGGWSSWSKWSTCSHGFSTRNRACNNPRRHTVAFSVTSPDGSLIEGRPIFTQTITNVGGGYSPNTAEFTCPVSGLYQFTLQVRSERTHAVYCYIQTEGIDLVYASTSPENAFDTATTSTYVQLTVSDNVTLGNCLNWDHVHQGNDVSFSGALIES